MRDKTVRWSRFEAVKQRYDCDAGFFVMQIRTSPHGSRDEARCIHAEIALEHSGQILWVTFASECALTQYSKGCQLPL